MIPCLQLNTSRSKLSASSEVNPKRPEKVFLERNEGVLAARISSRSSNPHAVRHADDTSLHLAKTRGVSPVSTQRSISCTRSTSSRTIDEAGVVVVVVTVGLATSVDSMTLDVEKRGTAEVPAAAVLTR